MINGRLIKKFGLRQFSTGSTRLFHPITFKESQINKNAIIVDNKHFSPKIIFPDHKFDLDLNIKDTNYTIKQLIEDSRKKFDKEYVLTVSFMDMDGTAIAQNTKASLLSRLSIFQISINNGEKIYNCINPSFMGNKRLDREIIQNSDEIDFPTVEKMLFKDLIPFKTAIQVDKSNFASTKRRNNVSYLSIVRDYVEKKYSVAEEYYNSLKEKREKRIQKTLNFFFYVSLTQTVVLNLCTFVFFNWDVMEPITTCITYVNIIVGFYFWALTNSDYEMESIIDWMRNLRYFGKPPLMDEMLEEKEELKKMINDDFKH